MIVIPMAGLSSRFKKSGYTSPKYMLEAHGETLFEHSIKSFKKYFQSEDFLFIALDVQGTKQFITEKCHLLNVKNFQIIILNKPTRGQAETVYLGLQKSNKIDNNSITIFNIDTFRPNFQFPTQFSLASIDGYLETFIGEGKNWSNILPKASGSDKVQLTAEKQEISQYCCTGLYYFSKAQEFCQIFKDLQMQDPKMLDAGEYYIAPMYNTLIKKGADIRFTIIKQKEVIFCGIPSEYKAFINNSISHN